MCHTRDAVFPLLIFTSTLLALIIPNLNMKVFFGLNSLGFIILWSFSVYGDEE